MDPQQPTTDEQAGMQWWNSLTEAERALALKAAGWKSGGAYTPSAADAWAAHKKRNRQVVRAAAETLIKCPDCGGTGGLETNGPEWVGPVHMQSCETCEGTGMVRDADDDEIAW
jgi:hypothetical protein